MSVASTIPRPLLAHRVISLLRSNWVAFGAKRTRPKSAATKTVQITGAASDPRLAGGVRRQKCFESLPAESRCRPRAGAGGRGLNLWAVWGPLPHRACPHKMSKLDRDSPRASMPATFENNRKSPHQRFKHLLSGAKRTWLKDGFMSAYDPKRTSKQKLCSSLTIQK